MKFIRELWKIHNGRAASTLIKGPDRIIPSKNQYTWEPNGAVHIQKDSIKQLQDVNPISIPTLFHRRVESDPDYPVHIFNRNNIHKQWTYSQLLDDVQMAAKALIQVGLEPHHGVAIIGFNSPHWVISHFGAIFAGGISAGVYTTSSPEACLHTASNSRANVFIVEDEMQLQKVLQVKERLPHLRAIVQYTGKPTEEGVLSWEDFLEIGRSASDILLKERQENMAVNQSAVLLYTSGTTGLPKGAMLSHDNVNCITIVCRKAWTHEDDEHQTQISYLPLCHIAAMIVDMYLPLITRRTVHFAKPDALKGSLLHTLREVRPSMLFAVPRVLEKLHEILLPSIPQDEVLNEEKRTELLQKLGLDRCIDLHCGAAPSKTETIKVFQETLKLPLKEAYGLTEVGLGAYQIRESLKIGSVGQLCLPAKIHNPDSEGEGELWLGGRTVFMGYLGEEEATERTFQDGWFKTGDLVRKDEEDYLFITSRIKELIITAGGENIPPLNIESAIKSELPVLSNCMVVGDQRKYLTALITLRTEKDGNTEELLDDLQPDVVGWCQSIGSNAKTLSDVLNGPDEKVFQEIQKGFDRANAAALARVQKVQKWKIVPTDFSMQGGELGPTLKLKRNVVLEKYAKTIDSMYEK